MNSVEESELIKRKFRDVMGRFATGVTVITTEGDDAPLGMTANGFMSISLEPPLVMISVRDVSRMIDAIDASGAYGVSVLGYDQVHLSKHFAGRPIADLDDPFEIQAGVSLIQGAIAHISADVVDRYVVGDHIVYIGHVKHADFSKGDPLLFHSGAYRGLSSQEEWVEGWNSESGWW